jgi:ectoine hydroxylase
VLEAGHDTSTTSYPLWTLDHAAVKKLADQFGLVAPKGPAGSVLMFHGCLAHASPGNISPYDRTICYVTYCSVENHITRFKRPEWIAHRDFTPIEPLADDCLADLIAREHAAE